MNNYPKNVKEYSDILKCTLSFLKDKLCNKQKKKKPLRRPLATPDEITPLRSTSTEIHAGLWMLWKPPNQSKHTMS